MVTCLERIESTLSEQGFNVGEIKLDCDTLFHFTVNDRYKVIVDLDYYIMEVFDSVVGYKSCYDINSSKDICTEVLDYLKDYFN